MKYEWKKEEKEIFGVKAKPILVNIPAQNYIMISGKGNPNNQEFSDKVSTLYSLAYGIKMGYKSWALLQKSEHTIQDFTVYPLEGVWKGGMVNDKLVKEDLEYTIMIKQPDFITKDMADTALQKVKKKKPSPYLDEISFDTMYDGPCIQILHVGSFDSEPESFHRLDEFAAENSLERSSFWHREIYLNNANRTAADRLKTILRYQVKHI